MIDGSELFEDTAALLPLAARKPLVALATIDGTGDAQNLMLDPCKSCPIILSKSHDVVESPRASGILTPLIRVLVWGSLQPLAEPLIYLPMTFLNLTSHKRHEEYTAWHCGCLLQDPVLFSIHVVRRGFVVKGRTPFIQPQEFSLADCFRT